MHPSPGSSRHAYDGKTLTVKITDASTGKSATQSYRVNIPLEDDLLELTAALRVALEVPDAEARWLAGEPVFAAARLP